MKIIKILSFFFLISNLCFSAIYPQFGFESTAGTNKLFIFSPWLGLRHPISSNSSLILKYYNHGISFEYPFEDSKKKITSNISNLSLVYYFQKESSEFYSALSYLLGTDSYRGLAFESGIIKPIFEWLRGEVGFYLLKESSVLWYPDENIRDIFLYSLKGSLKIKIKNNLEFHNNLYFSRNSEDVNAYSYSFGFLFSPKEPFYFSIFYNKYSESAHYKFSGNFFSLGINFYN